MATLVERGTKEIVALQHEVRDLQKKGDLALKQLEASATALETKRREINDAEVKQGGRPAAAVLCHCLPPRCRC